MNGTVVNTFQTIGVICGAVVAISLAYATIAKLRPVKWLKQTLVISPLSTWFRSEVIEANKPSLETLRTEILNQRNDTHDELTTIQTEISAINRAVNNTGAGTSTLAERVAAIESIVKSRAVVVTAAEATVEATVKIPPASTTHSELDSTPSGEISPGAS